MMIPEHTLRGLETMQTMSVHSAIAKKIIPNDREFLGGYRSLAEKLNAEAKDASTKTVKQRQAARRELRLQEQKKAQQ